MTSVADDVDATATAEPAPSPPRRVPWAALVTIGLAAVVVWGIVAGIGSSGSPDRVREITSRLRCPVCQGESVAESPSQNAQEITALVREQVAAGQSNAQIAQFFVDRYGDWILMDPPRSGRTLVLWAVPLLAVTGGAIALVSRLPRSRRRSALMAGAATLGLASTAVLVVAGALGRTDRDTNTLGAAPVVGVSVPATTPPSLDAVTDAQMEEQIAKTPNVIGMRLALVERYLNEGKIDDALRHTQAAIDSGGTDQELEKAFRLHGWVLALSGSPTLGADYLRAALTLSPDDRDAMYFLARVELSGLSDPDAAEAVLDKLRATDLTDEQAAHLQALQHDVDDARARGVTPAAPDGATVAASTP
ncbi:MAG: cytochrome c-type biogenesis protein CcmH [Ilumatobacteraceae bacterium]